MSYKMILAGAAIATIAAFGGADIAEAKGKGKHFHFHGGHFHKHRFHHRHQFYVAPVIVGGGCYYFKKKWLLTGRLYWKHKYYDCMGW